MTARVTHRFAIGFLSLPFAPVFILVMLLLCAEGVVLLMLDCDRDIKSPPQDVDVSPLVALEWTSDVERVTDILDPSILQYQSVAVYGTSVDGMLSFPDATNFFGYAHPRIWIVTRSSIDSAKEFFTDRCADRGSYHDRSEFVYGEANDTAYCISYVREYRSGPDGLCLPMGTYESMVIIRKRNVVIIIDEAMGDKAHMHASEVIKRLAEEFASHRPDDGGE